MSNQCPVCGGILVWDYQRGEVICSSCGLVVDRIYDYSPLRENEETITWRNIKIRNNPKKNKKLHEYKLHIRLYIKAQSYVKDKPWLEIDYEKIFRTGKMINTIKSSATIRAEKNITDKKLWKQIEHGLRIIEEIHPVALARSGRGKYALAYIVSTYIHKNFFPGQKEVIEIFNISETSYKRLIKLAKKILSMKANIPIIKK